MEISRKTDYALRMLADLVRQPDAIISVRKAADNNGVPYSFARAIQHDLSRAGIVESVRGARGGMRLAIDPSKTTMLDIVEQLQGPIRFAECETAGEGGGPCRYSASCCYMHVWCDAERIMRSYLADNTLEDVVAANPR